MGTIPATGSRIGMGFAAKAFGLASNANRGTYAVRLRGNTSDTAGLGQNAWTTLNSLTSTTTDKRGSAAPTGTMQLSAHLGLKSTTYSYDGP